MKKLVIVSLVCIGSAVAWGLDKEGILAYGISHNDPASLTLAFGLGANVEKRDGLGMTALMGAAWNNNISACRALLAAGADKSAVVQDGDFKGYTAASIAKQMGWEDIVALLIGSETAAPGKANMSKERVRQLAVYGDLYWTVGKGLY